MGAARVSMTRRFVLVWHLLCTSSAPSLQVSCSHSGQRWKPFQTSGCIMFTVYNYDPLERLVSPDGWSTKRAP